MENTDLEEQLKQTQQKLDQYLPIFLEKKKMFRGVKHEDSLSELRYTEFMVYKDMVEGLQKKVADLKQKIKSRSTGLTG